MAGDSSAADRNVEIWKIKKTHQARVAHAYNPSYLGGRDQEDQGLESAWANSYQDPI
jgi:hypothetical protein